MKKKNLLAAILGFMMFLSSCSGINPIDSGSASISDFSSNLEWSEENTATEQSSADMEDDFSSEDNDDCAHSDNNEDGVCDACEIDVTVTFDVFAVNDLHGKFSDTDSQIGVDELSTYFKQAREKNENTIVLSSGDMWQGTSESNLTKGALLTDWMSAMDFTSMTLGNHEYDWGETYIESNASLAEFPFLAINIYDNDTNQRVTYCQPSVMVKQSGAKIGIIGAIGDCHSSISGEYSSGFYFKTGSELTSLVKAEADRLRAKGADCIIYSLHDGYGSSSSSTTSISDSKLSSYYDVSLSNGYVDIVFEGHSHQNYVLKDSKGVYHMQGGGDNDGISHAEITVDIVRESATVNKAEYIPTSVYASLADDSIVEELLTKYAEEISKAGKVLGVNDKVRTGDEICQLVAELYCKAGEEKWGGEYDIVLGGGFLNVRSPYNLYAGEVQYGDLQGILPFDNEIVLCSIQGTYLKSKFIENSKYYIAYSEYGESMQENIDIGATYYVIVDTYTSTYAPNCLTEIARYDTGVFARDLVAAYIEEGGMTTGDNGDGNTEITLTSIPDIIAIGSALADNQTTAEEYYVKGVITNISNTTYGNMTIKDEEGNTLYIYGLNDITGAIRYDGMTTKPQVGDTIILVGPIQKYINNGAVTIEIYKGRLYSIA